jgi:hypothetical protein
MNKDDEEFFKLVGNSKSNYGIILLNKEKWLKGGNEYVYNEFKLANLVAKVVTCRLFRIKGCNFPLVYGSSRKEDDPRDSLKRVEGILSDYVRCFISLDKASSSNSKVEPFIYKKSSYSIISNGKSKLIPMVKLLHESELVRQEAWRGPKNKAESLTKAESLMNAFKRSTSSWVETPVNSSLSNWSNHATLLQKLKFLDKATIWYDSEIVDPSANRQVTTSFDRLNTLISKLNKIDNDMDKKYLN